MLRTRLTRSTVVVAALATAGALAIPTAAQAAPGDDILVFSNSSVVDTSLGSNGGEYEWISAAITNAGYTAVPFDGGDGSEAAWTTALADVDVFVLPEQESGVFYDPDSAAPPWLSDEAKGALIEWIHAGGSVIMSGACDPSNGQLLSDAVEVDYSDVFGCESFDTAPRWIDDAALPASLSYADGTYAMSLSDFSPAQLAPLTVWYSGESNDECLDTPVEALGVGVFAAGAGSVSFVAWDYYNDPSADQASWNAVLAALIEGSSASSTWTPFSETEPPAKQAVTATTASGASLYTVSPVDICGSADHAVFRIDPGTALAAPVGASSFPGYASQGAWSATAELAYLPFYDDDSGEDVLVTLDPVTGAFSTVGEFAGDDIYVDGVTSLAIGPDGDAYAFLEDSEYEGDYYELALYSVDLSDASLSFISGIDIDELDDPNGFAADPTTGLFYAFEEDGSELFLVDVATGGLTSLGALDSPSFEPDDSDSTALQIDSDGVFWVVFDEAQLVGSPGYAGMLATFTLADISAGVIAATEVGIITDGPIPSYSLLLVPGEPQPQLAATGLDSELPLGAVALVLLGGTALLVVRARRRKVS
jgi:hypothetical protein